MMTLEERITAERKIIFKCAMAIKAGRRIKRNQRKLAEADRMVAVLLLVRALPALPKHNPLYKEL